MNNILDEVAPVKKMRVRDKDVPYMTSHWKSAIRTKRKANDKYLKDKTPENWELRRKARNEATKQRRIAIKQYWYNKSNDLKIKEKGEASHLTDKLYFTSVCVVSARATSK